MKLKIDQVKIPHTTPLLDTLTHFDSKNTDLLLVEEKSNITGFLSDNYIRNKILQKTDIEQIVGRLAIKTLFRQKPDQHILGQVFDKNPAIELVPVVNNTVVEILYRENSLDLSTYTQLLSQVPVVIMAGGYGTRLYPFTKVIPKPLIPVGDKTIIELIINHFKRFGSREFILTVNYKANFIKAFFNDLQPDYEISFITEDKPLGTAGSLYMLKGKIDKPFFVSNCDIIINVDYRKFYRFHLYHGFDLTLIAAIIPFRVPYGVCQVNNDFSLARLEEKPTIYHLVNTGMYILNPDVLELIPSDEQFHMTQLMDTIIAQGGRIGVYPISNRSWKDYGQAQSVRKILQI